MSSKLNNTDIENAAQLHLEGIEYDLQLDFMNTYMPNDEMDIIENYITDAFVVGAKWGAQRLSKDMWHKNTEEPQEGKYIVFVTVDRQVVDGLTPYHSSGVVPWKTYVEATGLDRWIYTKDLFRSMEE